MRKSLLTNTRAHRLNSSPVLFLNSTCSASCSILKIPQPRSGKSSSEYQEDVEIQSHFTFCKMNTLLNIFTIVKRRCSYLLTVGNRDTGLPGIGSVSWFGENHDSWKEYIFEHYPEDFSEVTLTGEFTTADPAVEGDWYVTFPLSLIQAQGN